MGGERAPLAIFGAGWLLCRSGRASSIFTTAALSMASLRFLAELLEFSSFFSFFFFFFFQDCEIFWEKVSVRGTGFKLFVILLRITYTCQFSSFEFFDDFIVFLMFLRKVHHICKQEFLSFDDFIKRYQKFVNTNANSRIRGLLLFFPGLWDFWERKSF